MFSKKISLLNEDPEKDEDPKKDATDKSGKRGKNRKGCSYNGRLQGKY